MSGTSKTGLVPAKKREKLHSLQKIENKSNVHLSTEIAKPIVFHFRPYGGLYNPYAKGCSVLCNHPAPSSLRNVINQLRVSVASECKIPKIPREIENYHHETENIPEDLFRRYTGTDSRPLTPSPTVTSVRTRTSAGSVLNARRCITPELGNTEVNARKKLILDLRRSHSQETLYWKPSSDISQGRTTIESSIQLGGEPAIDTQQKGKQQKSNERKSHPSLPAAIPEEEFYDAACQPEISINEREPIDDDIRRGRRRKKIKPQQMNATFHLSEDPETQVATLGPDSLNPSARPSLIPNATANLLTKKDTNQIAPILLKGSYLTDEAFQALKTQLDVDVIENTFERYLNLARREAIKYIPRKTKEILLDSSKPIEKSLPLLEGNRKLPRKFSKSATRFEVPLKLKFLEDMSVRDYLSKYVWVSDQCKHLYKKTFLKYLTHSELETESDPDSNPNQSDDQIPVTSVSEYGERTMTAKNLDRALEDVLEFHGKPECIAKVLKLLDWDQMNCKDLPFRSWCGIVALAERLCLLESTVTTDSCDELEKCDFACMEELIGKFNISENLRTVLKAIRLTHNIKDSQF